MNFDVENTITGLLPHQKTTEYKHWGGVVDISINRCAQIRTSGGREIFDPRIVNHFIETDDSYQFESPFLRWYDKYKRAEERVKRVIDFEKNWRTKKQLKFNRINLHLK